MDFQTSSSPTSETISETESTSKENTCYNANKLNNNNVVKQQYVPVSGQNADFEKSEFKGRKTFAFWTIVTLLFILAIGNLILTVTILSVLRVGNRMEGIEFISEENAIKFFGDSDLGHVYKQDGILEGYNENPMEISAENGALYINLHNLDERPTISNKLKLDVNATTFRGFDSFDFKTKNDKYIFTLSDPEFKSLKGVNTLKTKSATTNRVVSPIDNDLKLEGQTINLKGSEGTTVEGREVLFSADQDIYLKSINGSIILSTEKGVFLDMNKIPSAHIRANSLNTAQYKLCVCMPEGKLFRIPVSNGGKNYCDHINISPENNPCI